MAAMADTWEFLQLRGLAATDERAEEFTGTLDSNQFEFTPQFGDVKILPLKYAATKLFPLADAASTGRLGSRTPAPIQFVPPLVDV